jgi:hypothetical protein
MLSGLGGWVVVDETRPAFCTIRPKRQMHTAVFLAPKACPESVVEPYPLVALIILECWVATGVTLDIEQHDRRNEKNQTNCRWPKIAEWPADEAAQNEDARCKGSGPLPPTSYREALCNLGLFRSHSFHLAAPTYVRNLVVTGQTVFGAEMVKADVQGDSHDNDRYR